MPNRQESNLKILDLIREKAIEHPELRFFQLMYFVFPDWAEDKFLEESSKTLEELTQKQ